MNINDENGFTIVQAIFILVVLALLGTYMVKLSTTQQSTTTQALLQARAYQAARAGLEWGIPHVLAGNTAGASFPVDGTGCDTVVTVTTTDYREGTTDLKHIHQIKSVAESAGLTIGSPDYVSRTLEVTIHD